MLETLLFFTFLLSRYSTVLNSVIVAKFACYNLSSNIAIISSNIVMEKLRFGIKISQD